MKKVAIYIDPKDAEIFVKSYRAFSKKYHWETLAEVTLQEIDNGKLRIEISYNPAQPEFLLLFGYEYCEKLMTHKLKEKK
jgi:hypothetical protein